MPDSKDTSSEFDREKWSAELKLRERELSIKEEEIKLKREENAKVYWRSPLIIALVATFLAAIGNLGLAWYNGSQQHKLETERTDSTRRIEGQKAEAALILEVVKTNDPDKAAVNLAFLLEAGLVAEDGRRQQISSYLGTRKSGQGPQLSALTGPTPGADSEGACTQSQGDHVIVGVHWGDADGGLVVRTRPKATQIGIIPSTGIGVTVGSCEAGWCQVRHKCLSGWAFARYIALRTSRLHRVTGIEVTDVKGLTIRKEPQYDAEPSGAIPANATDVIVHVCEPILDQTQWCQVTYDKFSGWVTQGFLVPQEPPSLAAGGAPRAQ
jgi:SH3-like domain-containing protein